MKKINVLAVAAMVAFGAFADAQVYEMTITIKTTLSKSGKITPIVCDTPTSDVELYRKQSTVKIKGLFWGCDCETIAEPEKIQDATATYGYIFWNETTHKVIEADFGWKVLNRIDKKLKKAEGTWSLEDDTINLLGGGFGTIKDAVSKQACMITSTIVTPMSGNVAGWMSSPEVVVTRGTDEVCEKCQVIEGTDDVVAFAPGWSLCACDEGSEYTAVSGSWKLKFVASAAKQWGKVDASVAITSVYSFPSYVASYIKALSN